ncbi:cyclodeaminase/cyclohydrolase family protein [Psychrilyobacter sp.]|uniref:cyclodeaminase/cyclohydrolase family protein n=1 Tax=Psychrilyobacter sp. TaxID=2586924 RepID=UPI003017AD5C
MSYLNVELGEFIEVVDSNAPAPGGGSVSALSSSLGIALSRMMAALAIDKKKYREFDDMIKEEFLTKHRRLLKIRKRVEILIDEDTKVFNDLMEVFKLPKDTDENKKIRDEEIQKATLKATEVPFEIAKVSLEAMELLPFFSKYGNLNAVTDLGVGAMLLETGVRGAILNVKINLGSLKDQDKVERFKRNYERIEKESILLKETIMDFVNEKIKL